LRNAREGKHPNWAEFHHRFRPGGVSAIDVAVSLKYVLSQKFILLISFLQILQKLEPFSLPASGNVYDSEQWWLHQAHPVPVTRLLNKPYLAVELRLRNMSRMSDIRVIS